MKNRFKTLMVTFTLGCLVLLVNTAKSQTVNVTSIIPDSVNVWGAPMTVDMMGTETRHRFAKIATQYWGL